MGQARAVSKRSTVSEYEDVFGFEAADGLTGEIILSALGASGLPESQKLVLKSVMGSIIFNTTSTVITEITAANKQKSDGSTQLVGVNASSVSSAIKRVTTYVATPNESMREEIPKYLLRHAVIPTVAHTLVHCLSTLAGSMAVHAAMLLESTPQDCLDAIDFASDAIDFAQHTSLLQ